MAALSRNYKNKSSNHFTVFLFVILLISSSDKQMKILLSEMNYNEKHGLDELVVDELHDQIQKLQKIIF